MSQKNIKNLFYLAGIINIIGTIILSKFFSNTTLIETDPVVMSKFGLIMITVWGMAFLATANHYGKNKWIVGVFCIEKLAYVIAWGLWYFSKEYTMTSIFEKDLFAGIFYAVYGLNDLLFLIFFCYVFNKVNNAMK